MKKNLKTFLVGISALTVLMTSNLFPVCAFVTPAPEYHGFVEEYCDGKISNEEIFLEMYNNEYSSIYCITNTKFELLDTYYYFEQRFDNTILLGRTKFLWNNFSNINSDIYTIEEVNNYLQENNLKADATEIKNSNLQVSYDEDVIEDDVINVIIALYQKYDVYPELYHTNGAFFEYEPAIDETSPTVTFGTPTIAGDVDMNGESGITDIVKLSKYTSNAELFPITDPTALANADVTQDGVIDQLDTNMLIEIALGTYESAV